MQLNYEEKLARYAELKAKENEVADEIDELKVSIMKDMAEKGIDKQPTSKGIFTTYPKKTWKYSSAVEAKKKELDDLKTEEEQTGTAVATEQIFLKFSAPKKEDEQL